MIYKIAGLRVYRNAEMGGASGGDTDPAAAAQATPAPVDTTPQADPAQPAFAVPDAYKDKPWAAKVKSPDDLWKQLDGAQGLIGKKVVVPDFEKADPKDIEDYVAQLRPKDKTAYKFDDATPAEQKAALADMLHEVGIPAFQANKLIEKYKAIESAEVAKAFDNTAFIEDVKKAFGDGYEEKFKETTNVLKNLLPPETFKLVDIDAPNIVSATVYKIAAKLQDDYKALSKQLHDKYGAKELGVGGEADPSKTVAVDIKALQKQIRAEIFALDKRPHTAEEKAALQQRLNATYTGA
jgi:hypothetical protein